MKKLLLLSALLIMCLLSQAQIAGVNFSEAKTVYNDDEIVYEKLLKTEGKYLFVFQQTPVGVKHCVEKMDELMELNDLNADNAWNTDILLADYVDGLNDYGGLCTSLKAGSSEVIVSWQKNGYIISLMMTDTLTAIGISKL